MLRVAQTHHGGGARPCARESFVCVTVGAGVKCSIRSVPADGQTVFDGFGAAYGGPPAETEGISGTNRVRLTRVTAYIADATAMMHGCFNGTGPPKEPCFFNWLDGRGDRI
jgi:hypothetical protein